MRARRRQYDARARLEDLVEGEQQLQTALRAGSPGIMDAGRTRHDSERLRELSIAFRTRSPTRNFPTMTCSVRRTRTTWRGCNAPSNRHCKPAPTMRSNTAPLAGPFGALGRYARPRRAEHRSAKSSSSSGFRPTSPRAKRQSWNASRFCGAGGRTRGTLRPDTDARATGPAAHRRTHHGSCRARKNTGTAPAVAEDGKHRPAHRRDCP